MSHRAFSRSRTLFVIGSMDRSGTESTSSGTIYWPFDDDDDDDDDEDHCGAIGRKKND
jgi:hypothetical protein